MPDNLNDAERCNRAHWDEIAPVHLRAYEEVAMLKEGKTVLDEIELRELGDVRGKTMLHLQCHIGTDTLSWVREGAIVTGVDFSAESIAAARRLQQELGLEATFIQSNVYDLPAVLHEQFDIVYTSRGVLCWLKDLDEWGRIITHFLKPGGIFYIMEGHPAVQIFDDNKTGDLAVAYSYFHTAEPMYWNDESGDYADHTYVVQHPTYEWQWSISDILNALLKAGLQLEFFNEYDRLFYEYSPAMEKVMERWYDFPKYRGMVPLVFTLRVRKGLAQ